MAYIGVQLLREEVLSQLLSGEDGGSLHQGEGHVPLARPAQGVQGTHDRTKSVLNSANGNPVLGAEHRALAQGSPILSFL